jgi:hypothetical protein
MIRALLVPSGTVRGCPAGPFPGWCGTTWATYNPASPDAVPSCQPSPLPAGAAGPLRPGVCYSFGPHAVSWWTAPHIALIAVGAVVLITAAVICGLRRSRAERERRLDLAFAAAWFDAPPQGADESGMS